MFLKSLNDLFLIKQDADVRAFKNKLSFLK